jgi:hypothetical protein
MIHSCQIWIWIKFNGFEKKRQREREHLKREDIYFILCYSLSSDVKNIDLCRVTWWPTRESLLCQCVIVLTDEDKWERAQLIEAPVSCIHSHVCDFMDWVCLAVCLQSHQSKMEWHIRQLKIGILVSSPSVLSSSSIELPIFSGWFAAWKMGCDELSQWREGMKWMWLAWSDWEWLSERDHCDWDCQGSDEALTVIPSTLTRNDHILYLTTQFLITSLHSISILY